MILILSDEKLHNIGNSALVVYIFSILGLRYILYLRRYILFDNNASDTSTSGNIQKQKTPSLGTFDRKIFYVRYFPLVNHPVIFKGVNILLRIVEGHRIQYLGMSYN